MEEITDGPEEGFYEECASGRDYIVKTHFPMGVNGFPGINTCGLSQISASLIVVDMKTF